MVGWVAAKWHQRLDSSKNSHVNLMTMGTSYEAFLETLRELIAEVEAEYQQEEYLENNDEPDE